ncbi:MAG: hypothetical protein JW768_04575 [Chitinispirillaceae bacterium]|nr:hypothetical protein [Chitinispirillaceae bacterium]
MALSQQEIIDYASRYVGPDEMVDFAYEGDLFCLIGRDLSRDHVMADEEGWKFQGYGVCLGYTLDQESQPVGKWLWMHFASLAVFPPVEQVFKLQPPHVVKGRFQNPGRTSEFRIIKLDMKRPLGDHGGSIDSVKSTPPKARSIEPLEPSQQEETTDKVVPFRRKRKNTNKDE